MSGNSLVIFEEGCFRNHHTVAKATEVGAIAHFFGEDIAWIDLTRDVKDVASFGLVKFADVILAKIEMFDAFGCARGSPLKASGVVVVYLSATRAV